ncbi:hypothetical protein [Ascidiaceihabitans sp.]
MMHPDHITPKKATISAQTASFHPSLTCWKTPARQTLSITSASMQMR